MKCWDRKWKIGKNIIACMLFIGLQLNLDQGRARSLVNMTGWITSLLEKKKYNRFVWPVLYTLETWVCVCVCLNFCTFACQDSTHGDSQWCARAGRWLEEPWHTSLSSKNLHDTCRHCAQPHACGMHDIMSLHVRKTNLRSENEGNFPQDWVLWWGWGHSQANKV